MIIDPQKLKSIDESVRDFSESVNDNAFTHSGDIFKELKKVYVIRSIIDEN